MSSTFEGKLTRSRPRCWALHSREGMARPAATEKGALSAQNTDCRSARACGSRDGGVRNRDAVRSGKQNERKPDPVRGRLRVRCVEGGLSTGDRGCRRENHPRETRGGGAA